MRVITGKQMKQIEQNALSYDLTYHRLMENAGAAAAAFIRRTFKVEDRNCIIFCSKGNNGGDGFVVARKLAESGVNVLVALTDGKPKSDEALAMYIQLEMMEVPILEFESNREKIKGWIPQTDLIVDAIYGIGFRGELSQVHREICQIINDAAAAVIALDLPTGVECDSGTAQEGAVRADFTIAFDSLKPAHFLPFAASNCGRIEVVNIGIPPEAHFGIECKYGSLSASQVFDMLPVRAPDSHKGDYGRILNVSGSLRYRGAAILSTVGALRSGAGLVTLASPEPVCMAVSVCTPEAMLLPLTGKESVSGLCEEAVRSDAILIGCGLGQTEFAAGLVERILRIATCPVVLDADGLNLICGNIHILSEAKAPLILTPHPGEMARLTGKSVEEVQADRIGVAVTFAREHNLCVVLKGHRTLIASPGGLLINETGGPGLAKGGSGDLLAGIIASFLAQGLHPQNAAAAAVFLHGMASDKTALRISQTAMQPHDIVEDLSRIFVDYQR